MVFVSLGFDLCEVGQEEVILKTGKQANRRTMHFALQALLALFGKSASRLPGATGTALGMVWEGEELSECLLYVREHSKNKLPVLLDLSLWCAHVQYMSDEEIKGRGSAGGIRGEAPREGWYPELACRAVFRPWGKPAP